MPQIIQLPPRSNAILYTDAEVNEIAELLKTVKYPQAVIIDDVVCRTMTAARNRANIMRAELLKRGVKSRAHGVQTSQDTTTEEHTTDSGKIITREIGEFRAAISPSAVKREVKQDKDSKK